MKNNNKPKDLPRISFETNDALKRAVDLATAEMGTTIKGLVESWIAKHPRIKKYLPTDYERS